MVLVDVVGRCAFSSVSSDGSLSSLCHLARRTLYPCALMFTDAILFFFCSSSASRLLVIPSATCALKSLNALPGLQLPDVVKVPAPALFPPLSAPAAGSYVTRAAAVAAPGLAYVPTRREATSGLPDHRAPFCPADFDDFTRLFHRVLSIEFFAQRPSPPVEFCRVNVSNYF